MSKFTHYLEMAYRAGESYSGKDLLADSKVGEWLYDSGIRDKNTFSFTRQRTFFKKELPQGELLLFANVSKADPTIKGKITKLFKDSGLWAGEDKAHNGWEMAHGHFAVKYQYELKYGDKDKNVLANKKFQKEAEQIKSTLTANGIEFNYEPESYSFTFPSSITFAQPRWEWRPKGQQGVETLKSKKKVFADQEYADFLKNVYKAKSVDELPLELKSQISGLKVVK